MSQITIRVHIQAEDVQNMGNGTFSIALAGPELTPEEMAVLARLYPNLSEQAYRLLNQEALLGSLLTEKDMKIRESSKRKETTTPNWK